MKKTNCKIVKISTQILTCLILAAILCVSCIQIYDRCTFHKHVQNTAKEYVDSINIRQLAILQDSISCVKDSDFVKSFINTNARGGISLYNNSFNTSTDFEISVPFSKVLDILSKSDGILSANGITFLITLIVALLVTLLINRMEAEQKLREEIQDELNSVQTLKIEAIQICKHTERYSHILTRVASIYNLGVIIGNFAIALSTDNSKEENANFSKKAGEVCSRLSLFCDEFNNLLIEQKHELDCFTKDEKEILNTYLKDVLDELNRSRDSAERSGIKALSNILDNNIDIVKDIKRNLNFVNQKEKLV